MATILMVESWVQSTGLSLPAVLRSMGHRYVLMTRDTSLYQPVDGAPHPVVGLADDIVVADTNDAAATIRSARELARRRRIDGVLTTCDYYLETVAHVTATLGLPGAAPEAMTTATHKHLARQAWHAAGIAGPRFAVAADWPDVRKAASHLGYPLVAKPVDANSGTSVRLVDGEPALHYAFEEVAGARYNTRGQRVAGLLLLEEMLTGPEVSVETVTRGGRTSVLAVTAKSVFGPDVLGSPRFVEAGHVVPAPLDPAARSAAETLARRAVEAVGIDHGVGHVEIKLTPTGPRLVELNPRQGGGYIFDLVRIAIGIDPLGVLVDLALDRDTRPTALPDVGAAIAFVMAPTDGNLRAVSGVDDLHADPRVVRYSLPRPGPVRRPEDNNARIGYVVATSHDGLAARERAEAAVAALRLDIDGIWHAPVTRTDVITDNRYL